MRITFTPNYRYLGGQYVPITKMILISSRLTFSERFYVLPHEFIHYLIHLFFPVSWQPVLQLRFDCLDLTLRAYCPYIYPYRFREGVLNDKAIMKHRREWCQKVWNWKVRTNPAYWTKNNRK